MAMSGDGSPTTIPPQWQIARLMDGFLTTQALYIAAKLGVADALADGPRTGRAIAEAVGADPDALTRVLRGLVLEDVLAEEGDGRFALTPLGACLRDGVPGSLRGAVLARGEVYYGAAAGLLRAIREGGVAFEHVHGEPFFDHLTRHPEREAAFQASMAGRAAQEAAHIVATYDFSPFGRIVDVGGGQGILLAAILRAVEEDGTQRRGRRLPPLAGPPRLAGCRRAAYPRRVPGGDAPGEPVADRRGDPAGAGA
jgi:hypothetical protein